MRRWRTAAANWLNGLPVTQDEVFDSASIKNELCVNAKRERQSTMSSLRKLYPKSWRRRRAKSTQSEPILPLTFEDNDVHQEQDKTNDEESVREGKAVLIHMSQETLKSKGERPPVRIIQLPPEPVACLASSRRVNRKDDIHSTLITNEIHTAKYTMINFLPKNIAEQMRRVANVYFVLIVFLQCFPAISNYNPFFAAMPILIIIAITAIKDAVEDWRRHQQDNQVNYSTGLTLNRPSAIEPSQRNTRFQRYLNACREWRDRLVLKLTVLYCKLRKKPIILEGKHRKLDKVPEGIIDWKETFWRDMRVGDIVLLRNNEMIPADMMILSTSEPDGICFVETKNLDGETNLKIRKSPMETEWIKSPEDAFSLMATIEVDLPNSNLYTFNGRMIISKDVPSPIKECHEANRSSSFAGTASLESDLPRQSLSRVTSNYIEPTIVAVNHEGVLLRGCILRNTGFLIGVIVYTGPHTKLMMNSGGTPSKRTRIERQMNPQIILSFALLFIICVSCAIVQSQMGSAAGSAPYYVASFRQGLLTSSTFLGFLTFWSSLILFQTLVPISMYVTVEIVKTIQVAQRNDHIKVINPM